MDKTNPLGDFIRENANIRPGSLHRLAIESGIAWATINRKIDHPELFTLGELAKIAVGLGVKPSELPALTDATSTHTKAAA